MPIVNYVREHERFIEYAADEGLTACERCLWYALMHIFNQRANGNVWPDDFIRVKNDRLFTYFPGGFDTLARARNRLKQKGLIDFRAGNRNQAVPMYRMHYFESSDCPACYPQKTDNIQDNIRDNIRGNVWDNTGDNIGDNIGDQYPNRNDIRNRNVYPEEDEEEVYELSARAYEDYIRTGFMKAIHRMPNPEEIRFLTTMGNRMEFGAAMMVKAIRIAAKNGANVPCSYVSAILDEWDRNEVRTPMQADSFQAEKDMLAGRNGLYASGDPEEDARISEENRERRRAENLAAGIGKAREG